MNLQKLYRGWHSTTGVMRNTGSRVRRLGVAIAVVSALGTTAFAQTTVTRSTEYDYDPVTGQIILERVDPGGTQCVETSYTLDGFGNRKTVTVRPCSSTAPAATFTPRVTTNYFDASNDPTNLFPDTNNAYPAGAYLTRSTAGTSSQVMSESRGSYDPRFGSAVSHTEVARADATRNLSKRIDYDGFGRVVREYAPVKRNGDGSVVEARAERSYVYCLGPKAVATPPPSGTCLSLSLSVGVSYDATKRLVDTAGTPTNTATISFLTAYYLEVVPRDAAGNVVGAKSRVHFDSLHREIAKETQAYDGRWVRTLTGYDQLGMVAATWGAHFSDIAITSTAFTELRQWAAVRDLLHRPVDQRQYWRGRSTDGAIEVSALAIFNGLETKGILPADSSPDGVARTTYARKNGAGQTVHTENADGATLKMAYDAVGNLIKTTDALGNETTITYTPGTARFKTGMVDPDQGSWSYSYDALGQLKSQTDARSKTLAMTYDDLGRVISKTTPALSAFWFYDRTEAGSFCASGLNRPCESKTGISPTVNRTQLVYDSLGRAFRTVNTLDRDYVSEAGYDDLGRLSTARYPTGFTVKYAYTSTADGVTPGMLKQVSDNANASRVFWSIAPGDVTANQVFDAKGNLIRSKLGNGVVSDHVFDNISGKPFNLRAGTSGPPNVFDLRYEYDKARNVVRRTEGTTGVFERFAYDVLDRLTQYMVEASASDAGAPHTVNVKYNALGNILEKGDVGGYTYTPNDKPHAVRTAGGSTYSYDGNGNMTGSTGAQARTQTWTDFNLPDVLSYQGRSVAFTYDAAYKRVKEVTTNGSTVRTLYLVHPDNVGGLGFEREETRVGGSVTRNESRHYISAGGGVVAVVKTLDDAAAVPADPNLTNYWHKDALGSIVAVTNASGTVLEQMAFDAWGRRQRPTGRVDPFLDPSNGNRGFTGHEHLDELGLIHMNGRVYDPFLGRFLSPDSVVEAPEMLQSYNRYSYVLNNPLKYTDPSGHCIWDYCIAEIAAFIIGYEMTQKGNQWWQMVGSIMMMWAGQGLTEAGLGNASELSGSAGAMNLGMESSTFNVGGFGNSFVAAAGSSFVSSGGDLSQALKDGTFAMAFTWAGGKGTPLSVQRLSLHALIGCVQGAASHGQCGPSAMSALVGKVATGSIPNGVDPLTRAFVTAVAGGTASVVGGGKFANGAFQSGFGFLFNHWAHWAELAAYGREAHQLLQDHLAKQGYVVERSCATPTNCVDGRFDIADARTKEVWEIKRLSFFGIGMGQLALEAYTKPETGLHRGGDIAGLKVDANLTLSKGDVNYTYYNDGGGLITYERWENPTPTTIYVPRWSPLPLPGGSRRRDEDRFGY